MKERTADDKFHSNVLKHIFACKGNVIELTGSKELHHNTQRINGKISAFRLGAFVAATLR